MYRVVRKKVLLCILPLKTPTKIAYIKERTQPKNRDKYPYVEQPHKPTKDYIFPL